MSTSVDNQAFASETNYKAQRQIYQDSVGPDPRDTVFEQLLLHHPTQVLDAGCGLGEFARRVADQGFANVVAIDSSPRMVELTQGLQIEARVGDVCQLEFSDEVFDMVVANWVLHYLPAPGKALAEFWRVLVPGGWLIAATNSETHMGEIWQMLFGDPAIKLSFSSENGSHILRRHRFANIQKIEVNGSVIFPDYYTARQFVARHIGGEKYAEQLTVFSGSLNATRRAAIFVAQKRK